MKETYVSLKLACFLGDSYNMETGALEITAAFIREHRGNEGNFEKLPQQHVDETD